MRFVCLAVLLYASAVRADSFDHYTNPLLIKAAQADGSQKMPSLSIDQMIQHNETLPGVLGTFVVVKTNDGRMSKLILQPAQQKVTIKEGGGKFTTETVPIIVVDRFVTYRDGEEKTVLAKGENLRLFKDFHVNLDMGQVVPAGRWADLKVTEVKGQLVLEPVNLAEVFLVTKHLAEATPAKGKKLVVGAKFDPAYFTGKYKLYEDGRRSGTLVLNLEENGTAISGSFYSDKDGKKYEVEGEIGTPNHAIRFRVVFPQIMQLYTGLMFTGDASTIAGTANLQGRETGFYAKRIDE